MIEPTNPSVSEGISPESTVLGGPTFENDEAGPEGNCNIEELVQIAEQGLERGDGQHVGSPVPRDIVQRVEMGRNCGDGHADDAGIERE